MNNNEKNNIKKLSNDDVNETNKENTKTTSISDNSKKELSDKIKEYDRIYNQVKWLH